VCLQVDLFESMDNTLEKSDKQEFALDAGATGAEQGFEDWFEVDSIRYHVLKVKVLYITRTSEFVEKPIGFECHGSLLFKKICSNLSFLVGDEVIPVLQGILTSRSDYFRAMLEGSFKEAQVPMTVESKIPINGIDVDVFKMIIEWIYTMDIQRLNNLPSRTLLIDLENVYVAADMYLIPDLCEFIVKYLNLLVTDGNFGEIHQVAKRIGSESLEMDVMRSWISKSDSFNKYDNQIKALIRDFEGVEVEGEMEVLEDQEGVDNEFDAGAIIGIQRKMIAASSWDGESDSTLSVVKCLASLLSVDNGTKKRKIQG
jgi:hypothetical protein